MSEFRERTLLPLPVMIPIVSAVRVLHYVGAVGIIANILLATVLFEPVVRRFAGFVWSHFDASHRTFSFLPNAEWSQRSFLVLSAIVRLYIFVATASQEGGAAFLRSIIDR